MDTARLDGVTGHEVPAAGVLCPFELKVDPIARFLNCELVDDPTYDGLELQYFDDPLHGTGMLAFLSRRADRRVDFYHEPGLTLDPTGFVLGGGIGEWRETIFDLARLQVADDGVDAEVRFTDVDGRSIEVRVDDRDGRHRRRGALLAPVGASIEAPHALLLAYLHGFDLVRDTGPAPVIRVAGRTASTGRLPGARFHRRLLIKHAAPISAVQLNPQHDGVLPVVSRADPGGVELDADGQGLVALTARHGAHHARLALAPSLPDLAALPPGSACTGRWTVEVGGAPITGGTWSAQQRAGEVQLALDVEDRWRPRGLPWLLRLVTTVVPVFRRWPTTYRWTATVTLGPQPTMTSRWERTTSERGESYRRATAR